MHAQSIAPRLPLSPRQRDEYAELSAEDRAMLSTEALARWSSELGDDAPLGEIVAFERRRIRALKTLRSTAELSETEFRMLRFLQRREGKVTSYLLIARHLFETKEFRITAAHLRGVGGFASPIVGYIHNMASNIRRKLEIDPIRPQHLATVRGCGYIWYDAPPSFDDGINYEKRATEIGGLQRTMHQLIGVVSEEQPIDYQLAAQVGLELGARTTIDAEYEPVE